MNRRIAQALATLALLGTASHEVLAYDWMERAARGCEAAHTPAADCQRTLERLRSALHASGSSGGANGGSGNGSSHAAPWIDTAAAAVAAYVVLESAFPDQQPELEVKLAVILADFPESQAKADALAKGRRIGEQAVAGAR